MCLLALHKQCEWVISGRVYSSKAKNTKSVIVFDDIDYLDYKDLY